MFHGAATAECSHNLIAISCSREDSSSYKTRRVKRMVPEQSPGPDDELASTKERDGGFSSPISFFLLRQQPDGKATAYWDGPIGSSHAASPRDGAGPALFLSPCLVLTLHDHNFNKFILRPPVGHTTAQQRTAMVSRHHGSCLLYCPQLRRRRRARCSQIHVGTRSGRWATGCTRCDPRGQSSWRRVCQQTCC